jgi:DNA-binding Lrp family transcriptional regulator
MDSIDKKLLNSLQESIPLTEKPFLRLAEKLGRTEEDILERIRTLKKENLIRQISAIFEAKSLGYESALIGMKIPPELLDKAGAVISKNPGVSHNYARRHPYNLWFTIALPKKASQEQTIREIGKTVKAKDALLLPALRIFKLRVRLNMLQKEEHNLSLEETEGIPEKNSAVALSEREIALIKELQEDFPLSKRPFKTLADRVRMDEKEVIAVIKSFKERGIMRRLAAVLHHREAGFLSNIMVAWKVPRGKIEVCGRKMASFKAVSHCYERKAYPRWPYNVYTMLHGRSDKECEAVVKKISAETGIEDYLALKTEKEYKKARPKYFFEP